METALPIPSPAPVTRMILLVNGLALPIFSDIGVPEIYVEILISGQKE
jgi:hypothetical protein